MANMAFHRVGLFLLSVCLAGAITIERYQRVENPSVVTEDSIRQPSRHGKTELISGPGAMTITGPSSVKVGDTVTFYCFADCVPACNISWHFQGKVLDGGVVGTPVLKLDQFAPASKLVTQVELYSGTRKLECSAVNSQSGESQHTVKNLIVTDEIAVTADNMPLPIAGKYYSLKCVGARQPSFIQWTVNFQPLSPSSRVYLADDNATLIFDPLQQGDSALYQCTVREQNKVIPGIPYELNVIYGPVGTEITTPSVKALKKHLYLNPGSAETLVCAAECYPKCVYVWALNGEVVSTQPTFSISSAGAEDNGVLTCTVANPMTKNTVSVRTNIAVIDGPHDLVITGSTFQKVGVKTTFQCSAICSPPCGYSWELHGQTVTGSQIELTLSQYEATETLRCKAVNNVSGKTATANRTIDVTDPDWCGC